MLWKRANAMEQTRINYIHIARRGRNYWRSLKDAVFFLDKPRNMPIRALLFLISFDIAVYDGHHVVSKEGRCFFVIVSSCTGNVKLGSTKSMTVTWIYEYYNAALNMLQKYWLVHLPSKRVSTEYTPRLGVDKFHFVLETSDLEKCLMWVSVVKLKTLIF